MLKRHSTNTIIQAVCAFGILLFFICIPLHIFGVVSVSFHGFGVDSSGRMYIGEDGKIVVFENGQAVDTIDKYTDRGYVFTITEEDTLLLSTASFVYEMDISGSDIIEKYADEGTKTYNALNRNKYEFITKDGQHYSAKNILGFLTIYKGETLVYHMPLFAYFVMILTVISFPLFFFACYWFRSKKHA